MAVAFSGNGQRLVAVTGDNRHTVHVYHWKSKALIHSDVGHNGQPPQVAGAGVERVGGGVGWGRELPPALTHSVGVWVRAGRFCPRSNTLGLPA